MKKVLLLQSRESELAPYEARLIAKTADLDLDELDSYNFLLEDLSDLSIADYRAVIMSGSSAVNISDGYLPWFDTALRIIKNCEQQNIPFLGICFGMQMLAYAYGASLVHHPEKAEMGAKTIYFIRPVDSFLDSLPLKFEANCLHYDFVENLPSNLISLASSADCEHHIIKHRESPLYGLQFHPEHSRESIAEYLKFYGPKNPVLAKKLEEEIIDHDPLVTDLIKNFLI